MNSAIHRTTTSDTEKGDRRESSGRGLGWLLEEWILQVFLVGAVLTVLVHSVTALNSAPIA